MSPKKRVLTGVQPTGEAHLGNYLGAFRQWVQMQDDFDSFHIIVDLHAITAAYDPVGLPARVFDMAVSLLAVGIDPDRSILFVQSDIKEHSELQWLFNSVARVGDLERMTQYKDKSSRMESIPAGLLNYPVLQAADILVYKAEAVPVGEDQRQHLELTRDIARKFNARFGETFPLPEAIIPKVGKILGLDGNAKMSKSVGNTVGILAEPDEIWASVRTAVTDPGRVRRDDPGDPDVCNVFTLHKLISDAGLIGDIESQCRAGTRGCVDCKQILSESIASAFAPFRAKAAELRADPDTVAQVLGDGAETARAVASETLREVHERMGLDWRVHR